MMAHWYASAEGISRPPDYTQEGVYVHGVLHADVPFDYAEMPSTVPIVPVPRSLMALMGVIASCAPKFMGKRITTADFDDLAFLIEDADTNTPFHAPDGVMDVPVKPTSTFVTTGRPAPEPAPVPLPQQLVTELHGGGTKSEVTPHGGTAGAGRGPASAVPKTTKKRVPRKQRKQRGPTILQRVTKSDIIAVMHLPLKEAADVLNRW
jgi:hypothetical protein